MTKEKLNSIFFDELKLRINPEDFLTFSSDVDIEWWLEVYNEKIQNSQIKKEVKYVKSRVSLRVQNPHGTNRKQARVSRIREIRK